LNAPKEVIKRLIVKDGLLDILTVIPVEEIRTNGIQFIDHTLSEEGHKYNLAPFWKYFRKTWLKAYDPKLWNIHHLINSEDPETQDILINRTNNPLERYNKRFGEAFTASSKPSMVNFVEVMRSEAQSFVEQLDSIRQNKRQRPNHQTPYIHSVPIEYNSFVPIIETKPPKTKK
jgi:hypothetical protein